MPERAEPQTHLALFVALLALSCAFVLSLPVFPSQDGPMHVYYVHILASLIAHKPTPYGDYFYVRSYFPPYSLYYYVLMLLMKLAPVALAERLMVCLIFIVQACGFRVLARQLGASGSLAALWSLPLLLNWPLAMGFQNFNLSLALTMFALGIWWQMRAQPTPQRFALFLFVVCLVSLAHPVPLLLLLTITGFDLMLQVLRRHAAWRQHKLQLTGFLISCLGVVYVLHFTDKHRVSQNARDGAARLLSLHRILKLSTLGVFSGHEWSTYAYRVGLYAMFAGALIVAFAAVRERQISLAAFTRESPWLLLALGSAAVTLIAPSDMNGSHFFSDRLVLIPWLLALLAAGVHTQFSSRTQNLLSVAAALAVVCVLVMANGRIRPIANEQAAVRAAAFPEQEGAPGLLLGGTLTPAEQALVSRVSYNAYAWQQAYKFDQAGAVLLNPPWLDLPILALAQRPTDLDRVYSPGVLDQPGNMLQLLAAEPGSARAAALDRARFVLLSTPEEAAAAGLTASAGWSCKTNRPYLLCDRSTAH